jgi:hypothetical protein
VPSLADINTQWGDTFDQVAQQYGLDPDLFRAIALQENVNPSYNNPLGRSTDSGPYRYNSDQGRAAIEHQAKLLTDPNGPYRDFVASGSIHDLAKVYSPVGAKNDVYGTNASEPHAIASNLAKIKGQSDPIYSVGAPSGPGSSPPATTTAFQPVAAPAVAAPAAATGDPVLAQRIKALQAAMAIFQNASGTSPAAAASGPGYSGLNLASLGSTGGGTGINYGLIDAIRRNRAAQALQMQQALKGGMQLGGGLVGAGGKLYGQLTNANPYFSQDWANQQAQSAGYPDYAAMQRAGQV